MAAKKPSKPAGTPAGDKRRFGYTKADTQPKVRPSTKSERRYAPKR